MNIPIKISCVSYLNSKPFIWGLKHHKVFNEIDLAADNPAECAMKLSNHKADIGLVPIASIPMIENAEIISNYCISSDNEVKSVLLLSEVPLNKIDTIVLDYQSLTSINLVQILAREFWKINPVFENAMPGYENNIKGTSAAVVIGDRALKFMNQFRYAYDLAGEWHRFTGLPFVFACWVSNKKLESNFVASFNEALQKGVENIDAVIDELKINGESFDGVDVYLKKNLNFQLDAAKEQAISLFLNYLKKSNPVLARV
jgi:chorismate dehydratase